MPRFHRRTRLAFLLTGTFYVLESIQNTGPLESYVLRDFSPSHVEVDTRENQPALISRATPSLVLSSAAEDTVNTPLVVVQQMNYTSKVCQEKQSSPIVWTKPRTSPRPVSDFVTESKKTTTATANISSAPAAACRFIYDVRTPHFPHAMEQLLRCYSFWQSSSNPNNKPWILVYDESKNRLGESTPEFLKGFLHGLRQALNVSIVPTYEDGPTVETTSVFKPEEAFNVVPEGVGQFAVEHSSQLRQLTRKFLEHLDPAFLRQLDLEEQQHQVKKPRIAILGRKDFRRLLNQWELSAVLRSQNLTSATGQPTLVTFFEGKSFLDQVRFFASTDIIVSPHGAQLTGLPFMPECGAVLEVFSNGYFLPQYFGSLAHDASGLYHGAWYMRSVNPLPKDDYPRNFKRRRKIRARNACPPLTPMVEAVHHMVQYWHSCRREKHAYYQ